MWGSVQNATVLGVDDDGGGGGGAYNPMMNDVVIQRMFELSPLAELKNYRRVCKHWLAVARPLWLKTTRVAIDITDERDNNRLLRFLEQVGPNSDIITGAQQNRSWALTIKLKMSKYRGEDFRVIWTKCGVHLTQLTLQNVNLPDVSIFQDILFCRHTPNLESLVADIDTIEGEPVEPPLRNNNVIPLLLRKQTKLKTLKIDIANLSSAAAAAHNRNFPLDWKSLFITFPHLTEFGIGANLPYSSTAKSQMDRILEAMMGIRREDRNKLALSSFTLFFNNRYNFREQTLPLPIPASLREVELQIAKSKCESGLQRLRHRIATYRRRHGDFDWVRVTPPPPPSTSRRRSAGESGGVPPRKLD